MYKELFINFYGKRTSILIDWEDKPERERVPCFIVGLSSHYHDKFSIEFRSYYQLVLLDLYWTDDSYSEGSIRSLSLADMSDHVEKVRQALGKIFGSQYQKIVLLGHSAFGFLCLEYAFRHASHLHGIINICSPLHFKEPVLQRLQEEYLDSNFGPRAPNGPDQRWFDYYHYKSKHERSEKSVAVISDKEKFVRWYLSMGPILWKEPRLWQDRDGAAAKIWKPWSIPITGLKQQRDYTRRDVNMMVYNHYFELATGADYRGRLWSIKTPVLWYVGLFDARISSYHFESKNIQKLQNRAIDFYYVGTGHWPMCEDGCHEFDQKAAQWLGKIIKQEVLIDEQSRPRSKL